MHTVSVFHKVDHYYLSLNSQNHCLKRFDEVLDKVRESSVNKLCLLTNSEKAYIGKLKLLDTHLKEHKDWCYKSFDNLGLFVHYPKTEHQAISSEVPIYVIPFQELIIHRLLNIENHNVVTIDVLEDVMHLSYFEDKSLQFYQSYPIQTAEDVMYFYTLLLNEFELIGVDKSLQIEGVSINAYQIDRLFEKHADTPQVATSWYEEFYYLNEKLNTCVSSVVI